MRMSQEEKDKSHARIVGSASRLFRERGLEGASVADVMKGAGMTHGGFYKHFDTKDALVEAALENAFAEFVAIVDDNAAGVSSESPFAGLAALLRDAAPAEELPTFRAAYLSREHVEHRGFGCPVAALGTELVRGSAALKRAFGDGVRRMIVAVSAKHKGSAAARRTAAFRDFSMLVGAIVIARASDPELANEVLGACGGEKRNVQ